MLIIIKNFTLFVFNNKYYSIELIVINKFQKKILLSMLKKSQK